MSIRYKTALVFLATGLIPFLAVGTLVFLDFQKALGDNAFRHLEAVTNLQEARVNDLVAVYAQGAAYISEQPGLRNAVRDFLADPHAETALDETLAAAQSGGPYSRVAPFQELLITNPEGRVIATTNVKAIGTTLPVKPELLLSDIYRDEDGTHLRFGAPMIYDGVVLARLYITVNAQGLFAVTATRDGLGETGETFLVKRLDAAHGIFVSPLRFDAKAAFSQQIPLGQSNRPSAQAILEKDETFTTGAVSYRGQPVVAVTRYLPLAGLGIVGQIDQTEAFGPVQQLAIQVVVFAALLMLFTIFVGSFMAELFVKPILHLATAAGRLRKGDFSARAKIWSGDEIGQLGRSFNVMADDLAKLDQAKSDMLALISHQLRTPVTAVKGFVSLVLRDKKRKLTTQEATMLELAFQENEKLNKLITQILEVAHADSGKLLLNTQPTDLVALTAQEVKDHVAALKLRRQTIAFAPPSKPIKAEVDPEKLGLVISNLITNASKYSPEGSRIEVSLGRERQKYWIRVTDHGMGISLSDQRKLFQKFSRIENPRRGTAEGVGLGLYMAKKIVDLHKGELAVHSRENHGSSFTIELPINH